MLWWCSWEGTMVTMEYCIHKSYNSLKVLLTYSTNTATSRDRLSEASGSLPESLWGKPSALASPNWFVFASTTAQVGLACWYLSAASGFPLGRRAGPWHCSHHILFGIIMFCVKTMTKMLRQSQTENCFWPRTHRMISGSIRGYLFLGIPAYAAMYMFLSCSDW